MLINSTFHFLKLNELDQIYDYTGQLLLQNIPNSIIIYSSINHHTKEAKPIKFYGVNAPKLIIQTELVNFTPYTSTIPLSDQVYNLLENEMLIELKGGFKDFILNHFPLKESQILLENMNFENMFLVGSYTEGQLSGSIAIILREEGVLKNKEFIEAFISLSNIILNKKKTEIELKTLNATKDKFFSIISHDLKNPFNTFIGFSGLIIQNIDKISKEKILEFSNLIHDSALQSYEMMQNLFEWVVSQKGALQVKLATIHINALILSNIKLFSSDAVKKGIKINLVNEDDTNIIADIDMLNTIFRNLISNALKFTNKDGEIKISYTKTENATQFEVEDNGLGISDKNQQKIFKIGTNKSTAGTDNEKGTGLGLILCREFVELQGGKIWVESELGKGSKFKFYIPLNKSAAEI